MPRPKPSLTLLDIKRLQSREQAEAVILPMFERLTGRKAAEREIADLRQEMEEPEP
jgi:hypothetical protein